MPMLEGMTGGLMDGGALISLGYCWARGVGGATKGKLTARGGGEGRGARPAGRHPRGNNRGPVWGDSVGKFGCPAGGPVAHGLVRKEAAGSAIEPVRC